jgi:hypothetical protein
MIYCLCARPEAHQALFNRVGHCFTNKHYTRLEWLARDKHSSLLWTFVNYGRNWALNNRSENQKRGKKINLRKKVFCYILTVFEQQPLELRTRCWRYFCQKKFLRQNLDTWRGNKPSIYRAGTFTKGALNRMTSYLWRIVFVVRMTLFIRRMTFKMCRKALWDDIKQTNITQNDIKQTDIKQMTISGLTFREMTPEWQQNDNRMTTEWQQNDNRMTTEWQQNDNRMTPEWPQNDTRMTPEWHQIDIRITT